MGGLTVTGAVAALVHAVADLATTRSNQQSDEELLAETAALEQARRHLDSAELDRLAELDRRGASEAIAGPLTDVSDALASGSIGFDHARTISDATNPRNVDELASVAAELCDVAALTTFERWKAEVRGLADQLDADGGHDPASDAATARSSASLRCSRSPTSCSVATARMRAGATTSSSRIELSCSPRPSSRSADGRSRSTCAPLGRPGSRRPWCSTLQSPGT